MRRIDDLTEDYESADYNDENPVPAKTPTPGNTTASAETPAQGKCITPVETTTTAETPAPATTLATAETPAPAKTPATAETPAVEGADETTAGLENEEWHDLDEEWDAFAREWEIDVSKKKDGEKKKESLPDQQRKNAMNSETKENGMKVNTTSV